MSSCQLSEKTTSRPFAGARVDRDGCRIHDVLLCGTRSANGRTYSTALFKRMHGLYEGRPCNVDHGREATVDRRCGWFSNVRLDDRGRPRGTLNLLKSHPLTPRVLEAAERAPHLYGLSHICRADTRFENGTEVVEHIHEVESVDLVAQPATTTSLFEGKNMRLGKYLSELLVSGNKRASRVATRISELADDMPADSGMMDQPMGDDAPAPADGDHTDTIRAAMEAGGCAVWKAFVNGDIELDDAMKKLKTLAKTHQSMGDDDADDDADTDDEGADVATESRGVRGHRVGRPPTDPKRFGEWVAADGDGATIPVGSNAPGARRLTERRPAPAAGGKPPTDPKAFGAFITE